MMMILKSKVLDSRSLLSFVLGTLFAFVWMNLFWQTLPVPTVNDVPKSESSEVLIQASRQHRTSATPCAKKNITQIINNIKGQSGEDLRLLGWFNGLCGGTYIEMGGLDGITFSNSYVFNKEFQWKGLMVELGPNNYEKLRINRPNEIATINAGVCGKAQTLHYVERGPVGGIWEFSNEAFRQKWWKGITITDLNYVKTVECTPLKTILDNNVGNTTYFDFFSLDIEGGEYDALLSLDFNKYGFGFLVVEADDTNKLKNMALRSYLEQNGYTYLDLWNRSDWFMNRDFHSIYSELLHVPSS